MKKETEIILARFEQLTREQQEIMLRFVSIIENGPEELKNRIYKAIDTGELALAIKLIKGEG